MSYCLKNIPGTYGVCVMQAGHAGPCTVKEDKKTTYNSLSTRPYDPARFWGWGAHQWDVDLIIKTYGIPNRLNFWHPHFFGV